MDRQTGRAPARPQAGQTAPTGRPQAGSVAPSGQARPSAGPGRAQASPPSRSGPPDASGLPAQQAITDDAPVAAQPKRWLRVLRRVGAAALIVLALAFGYVFLLLGEPSEEDGVQATPAPDEVIRTPMNGITAHSSEEIPTLAAHFAKPVLTLQGQMQSATLFDTAFGGAFARRVTFVYAFEDGQTVSAESIRPVSAATLLGGAGYSLSVNQRYAMAGMDAVRMDSGTSVCVFAKGEGAVYAVVCPKSHLDELGQLLAGAQLMLAGQ